MIKFSKIILAAILVFSLNNKWAYAVDDSKDQIPGKDTHPTMQEDKDGILKPGEYIVISPNGAVTRAFCPYTCSDRGLSKENCKTWSSISNPNECYVWDTRLPNDVVPIR